MCLFAKITRLLAMLAAFGLLISACAVGSDEPLVDPGPSSNFDLAQYNTRNSDINAEIRGAQAYDQWFTAANAPTVLHPPIEFPNPPLYTIADTWRCSLCHAWDYQGASIFRFPPPNLIQAKARSANEIFNAIKYGQTIAGQATNGDHIFSSDLTDAKIYDLTFFIKTVIKTYDLISGNAANGDKQYLATCASTSCHGLDGLGVANVDLITLATDDPTKAKSNPAKFIHIMHFGSANQAGMPNARMLFPQATKLELDQIVIDILVYMQQIKPPP